MSLPLALTAVIVAGLLLVTVVFGLASLRKWLRFQPTQVPTAKIATHITLQVIAIALWISYIATANTWLAWTSFAVITAGQVFGDLLMFASYRIRHRITGSVRYRAVAGDVLDFSRPAPALHAIIGALGWFSMLATCIMATIG